MLPVTWTGEVGPPTCNSVNKSVRGRFVSFRFFSFILSFFFPVVSVSQNVRHSLQETSRGEWQKMCRNLAKDTAVTGHRGNFVVSCTAGVTRYVQELHCQVSPSPPLTSSPPPPLGVPLPPPTHEVSIAFLTLPCCGAYR